MFISLFARLQSLEKIRMCLQVTAIPHPSLAHCVSVCVCVYAFTRGLTLPIKFSVPAVKFIGGVKTRLGMAVRLLCAEAQCGDHGLRGQDAPLIQVCNADIFVFICV